MNYLSLSDKELLDYLDMFSQDPVVLRLLTMIHEGPPELVKGLIDAGMDRFDYTFDDYQSPGEYIRNLRFQIDDLENEVSKLDEQVQELKTKTVVNLISEMKEQISDLNYSIKALKIDRDSAVRERDVAKDKLSMWAKLNGELHSGESS